MTDDASGAREARRNRIQAVLGRLSPRLVFLFERAVLYGDLVEAEPMAVPMLGHALREMTRVLPRYFEIPVQKGHVRYEVGIDDIAKEWSAVDPQQRTLTQRQFAILDGLVTDHLGSIGRREERATALARTSAYGAIDEDTAVLVGLTQRWKKIEARLPDLAHLADDGTARPAEVALEVLETYEELLDHTLAGFWDVDADIKEALAAGPNAEAYARAKALPKAMQHWIRLYQQLGAEWLTYVIDAGDFDRPPAWVTRAERPMGWPALDYVQRVAAEQPALAAQALLRVPAGINAYAQAQVLEIGTTLPATEVLPLAVRARRWVKEHPEDMLVTEHAGRFMTHMATSGEIDAAFRIADALLATRWAPQPTGAAEDGRTLEARIGTYAFSQVLHERFPALISASPRRGLTVLIDKLGTALAKIGDQYWTIRLPSVGDGRTREGVAEMLVFATYQAVVQVAAMERAEAEIAMESLAAQRGTIMRRLELALLGATDLATARLNALYRDRTLFDDVEIFHEYAETLAKRWADLDTDTRDGIRQWIAADPTFEVSNSEDRPGLVRHWRRRWLAVIDGVMPAAWREEFAEALTAPAPDQPTRLVTFSMFSGPTSPRRADELQAMSNAELASYLETWVPPAWEHGPEPSVKGLARTLEAIVVADPDRFVPDLARFRALTNTEYVDAIGDGLTQAARNGASLEWPPVLEHLELQFERAVATADPMQRASTLWPVVRLLEAALGRARETYPASLREPTFALLEKLATHGDPPTSSEHDVVRANASLRADALETAIRYGLWVATVVEAGRTDQRLSENIRELGELLAARLAPSGEPDADVRAVTGAYLPQLVYLDYEWTTAHLSEVLPLPSDAPSDASWRASLRAGPFTRRIYDLQRGRYPAALDLIAAGVAVDEDDAFGMGSRLMTAHALGWDDGALLRRFLAVAASNVRHRVVHAVGSDISEPESTLAPETVARLEAFWGERIAAGNGAELRAFGTWFASGRFGASPSLELLARTLATTAGRIDAEHDVTVQLRELAPEQLGQVLEVFDRIVANLEHAWNAVRLEADGLELVRLGLASADALIHHRAETIRDRFGKLGYPSFEKVN